MFCCFVDINSIMGLNGYIVHNNFVYKSTNQHSLTYTFFLIVLAYVLYQKVWPTARRLIACGLRVAVNIHLLSKCYARSCFQAYKKIREFICKPPPRRYKVPSLIARFRLRYRQLRGQRRKAKVINIQKWSPPVQSPLAIKNSDIPLEK